MAIEMIENSDLPAIAQPMNGIVMHYSTSTCDLNERTDGDYSNFSFLQKLVDPAGAILNKIKEDKKSSEDASKNAIIAAVNKAFPVPTDDCEQLTLAKTKIDNELYKVNQEVLAGDSAKTKKDYVNALNARATIIKNKIDTLKCVEKVEQAQLEKNKQETLTALEQAKLSAPVDPNSNINKYLIWGISGLLVLTAIVILLKKKKSPNPPA